LLNGSPSAAEDSAIADFASANFGWLLNTGFDFGPIEGRIAPVGPVVTVVGCIFETTSISSFKLFGRFPLMDAPARPDAWSGRCASTFLASQLDRQKLYRTRSR